MIDGKPIEFKSTDFRSTKPPSAAEALGSGTVQCLSALPLCVLLAPAVVVAAAARGLVGDHYTQRAAILAEGITNARLKEHLSTQFGSSTEAQEFPRLVVGIAFIEQTKHDHGRARVMVVARARLWAEAGVSFNETSHWVTLPERATRGVQRDQLVADIEDALLRLAAEIVDTYKPPRGS